MKENLQNIREQLFSAPIEVKKAFNQVVEYFDDNKYVIAYKFGAKGAPTFKIIAQGPSLDKAKGDGYKVIAGPYSKADAERDKKDTNKLYSLMHKADSNKPKTDEVYHIAALAINRKTGHMRTERGVVSDAKNAHEAFEELASVLMKKGYVITDHVVESGSKLVSDKSAQEKFSDKYKRFTTIASQNNR